MHYATLLLGAMQENMTTVSIEILFDVLLLFGPIEALLRIGTTRPPIGIFQGVSPFGGQIC